MHARLGFGDEINELIPRLNFYCSKENTIFLEAINKCEDSILHQAGNMVNSDRIPDWCKDNLSPDDMILLPISIKNHSIGLIYIENVNCKLPNDIINYLDTCRQQIAYAIKNESN